MCAGSIEMKKVLVVDDEEKIRIIYKKQLEDDDMEVHLASSGEEALEMIEKYHFDIVSLDIKMSGINGIETLEQIKMRERNLPVILCSAYDDYKQNYGSWASDAYIIKSSNLEELKDAIKKTLSKK
jgi:DNA-binding NtrC family response regulator